MEIIISLSIVAILLTITVLSVRGSNNKAQYQQCITNVRSVVDAMEGYRNTNLVYYRIDSPSTVAQLRGNGLTWLPDVHCPCGQKNLDDSYYIVTMAQKEEYTVWCQGDATRHEVPQVQSLNAGGLPQYGSVNAVIAPAD